MRTHLLIAAVVLLSACGGDTEDSNDNVFGAQTCESWTLQPVTSTVMDAGCMDGDTVNGTSFYNCDDGRVLAWNAAVWGYVDEPFTTNAAGATEAPADAVAACGI